MPGAKIEHVPEHRPPQPAKRRDSARTKARILAAANETFAELGYARAGLRDIAGRADVASSLLIRYFGTKAALFEAALVRTIHDNSVFTQEKQGFGAAMARLVSEKSSVNISVMLVLALADPEAKAVAMRVSDECIIRPLAQWLGAPDAEERAMNMFSLLTGFVIQMQGLRSGPIPALSLQWLADSLQSIVDKALR